MEQSSDADLRAQMFWIFDHGGQRSQRRRETGEKRSRKVALYCVGDLARQRRQDKDEEWTYWTDSRLARRSMSRSTRVSPWHFAQ